MVMNMGRKTQFGEIHKSGGRSVDAQSGRENLDGLTGILKRDAAEARIASILNRKETKSKAMHLFHMDLCCRAARCWLV